MQNGRNVFIGIQYICVADIGNYHTFANSVTLVLINATEYEVKRKIVETYH